MGNVLGPQPNRLSAARVRCFTGYRAVSAVRVSAHVLLLTGSPTGSEPRFWKLLDLNEKMENPVGTRHSFFGSSPPFRGPSAGWTKPGFFRTFRVKTFGGWSSPTEVDGLGRALSVRSPPSVTTVTRSRMKSLVDQSS